MTPFTAEAVRQGYEILAIQEPWQNQHINATYCPSSCGYWPAYPKHFKSRVCFLVSKQIPLSKWLVQYPYLDIASLILQTKNYVVYIHNIYSAGLGGLGIVNQELPIYYLPQLFNELGEHIVIKDFNLHHPI